MNDPIYRTDVINAAMGRERMTNEQLATATGYDEKTISKARNGKAKSIDVLAAIAAKLNLKMSELFESEREVA